MSRRKIVGLIAAFVVVGSLGAGAAFAFGAARGPQAPTPAAVTSMVTTTVDVAPPSPTFAVQGAYLAGGPGVVSDHGLCTAYDIAGGARVSVYDMQGHLLAQGGLYVGQSNPAGCAFDFAVQGVKDGLPEYQVEIGQSVSRTVSAQEARGWLVLGSY